MMKIIVFIQSSDGKINSNSLEALCAAQKFSESSNTEVKIISFDENVANELKQYQSDGIIYINNSELKNYNPIYYLHL